MKYVAENAYGLRNEIVSLGAAELPFSPGPSSKKSVRNCLRVEVRKLIRLQVRDQMFPEGIVEIQNLLAAFR